MRRLHYFVPSIVVAIVGLGVYLWPNSNGEASGSLEPVLLGKDYYISAAVIELNELDPEGQPWDSYNNTGPDIYYEIYWKENLIYQSTVKEDSFVGRWTNAEINLRDVAIGSGTTSIDRVIQGARLNIREGESIQIRVYDQDTVTNDQAGQIEFVTTELRIGDSTHQFSGEFPTSGIRRLILRVIDMDKPVDVSR